MIACAAAWAEKLGMKNYWELAYLDTQKSEFNPDMMAAFRRQVKEVITPAPRKYVPLRPNG